MPFDAGVTAAVAAEIAERAVGAKIEKIQQPERDELVLSLKNGRDSRKLLISAKAGSARRVFRSPSLKKKVRLPRRCFVCCCASIFRAA